MALAFQAASAAISGTATSGTITWPGSPTDQLLIAVFGFEGVASGSGPWIDHIDDGLSLHGWKRVGYQAPSATGCGIEVWDLWDWDSGPSTAFSFVSSLPYVARGLVYTGQYVDAEFAADGVRASTTLQVTGDDANAPSVYAYDNEMLVVCAAQELQTPGWGTPTGCTQRFDSARGGSYGNVEITAADKSVSEGDTGLIPWDTVAETGSSKGATITLALRPVAAVVAATSPLIAVEYAVAL